MKRPPVWVARHSNSTSGSGDRPARPGPPQEPVHPASPMGFLVPTAPAYSGWDSLLQRSVVPRDHAECGAVNADVETPCKPPFVYVPSSNSPPLIGSPALSSAAAGHLLSAQPVHSIAQQLLQTPAELGGRVSASTDGTARQASGVGSRDTCSTGSSATSRASSSRRRASSASATYLEAQSLALAWRLQQEEQQALAQAIEANSPAPGSGQRQFRGGSTPRAPAAGGSAPPSAAGVPHDAGGEGEMMEMDGEEDASLRLAIRLQQEELHWHEIASRRTVSEAMHIEPAEGGAVEQEGEMQIYSDDGEP